MIIERHKNFQTVHPAVKGNYLTAYRDGEDIAGYTATTEAVLPLQIDASEIYREITPEEHAALDLQKAEHAALGSQREDVLQ